MTGSPLRLRPGVHVAPTADGLSVTGLGRVLTVPGPSALGTTWDMLFPAVHRGGPAEDLVATLPDAHQATGHAILRVLGKAGLLLDLRARGALDDVETAQFRRTVSYLEATAPEPYSAFRRLRETHVRVEGTGPAALAAGRTLLRAGVGGLDCPSVPDASGAEGPAEVVITVDGNQPPDSPLWCGVFLCGDTAVVGPCGAGPLGEYTSAATSPVAAALAGNLAALHVINRVAELTEPPHTDVIEVEGMRVTQHPVSPDTERNGLK